MADEIKLSFGVQYANGNLSDVVTAKEYKITQSTQGFYADLWTVGTSEENKTIPLADTGSGSHLMVIINTDNSNFCQIGRATTSYFLKLKPKEFAVIRWDSSATTIYAKSDTAATKILLKVYSE